MVSVTVAIDVGALHGHRTGVGLAVHHLTEQYHQRDDVVTMPYLTSFRARPVPPQRRLPLPAALAMRCWSKADRPRVDRWLAGADVVHGPNYVVPPTTLPSVVSVYDCWTLAHPELATPPVRRAGAALRRAVARGAWVHVSSNATAARAAELLDTPRVVTVHLGPPAPGVTDDGATDDGVTEPATAGTPRVGLGPGVPAVLHHQPFVLCLGTVERRKDTPGLVRAFRLAADQLVELHLVVAGQPGDDIDALRREIASLPRGVAERVHVLGAVDATTKAALLAGATALAYPSLDEGFGFPILEAHQAGTPVVARAVGSIPEIGGDAVELVEPSSTEALAAGLVNVATDDGRRAQLVRAGRRNLRRFSWSSTADGLVALYRRAIEERP